MSLDDKTLDLVCMGRAAVDLYGEQIGGRLEDEAYLAAMHAARVAGTRVVLGA